MASSPLMPRTSISCLKFSFFSYMLSCVCLLTKVAAWFRAGGSGAAARSNRSGFTLVRIMPKVTMAFFPSISSIVPTVVCPLMRTVSPGCRGRLRSSASRAACSKASGCAFRMAASDAFFSFRSACLFFRSCSCCILRAILSASCCFSMSSKVFLNSSNSWRTLRVFSFSA